MYSCRCTCFTLTHTHTHTHQHTHTHTQTLMTNPETRVCQIRGHLWKLGCGFLCVEVCRNTHTHTHTHTQTHTNTHTHTHTLGFITLQTVYMHKKLYNTLKEREKQEKHN